MNDIKTTATAYLESGLSVIPVFPADHPDPEKRKKPTAAWKKFQTQRATAEEVNNLFNNGANIAVIGGAVSGNVEIIDFDEPKIFPDFMDSLRGHDMVLADKLLQSKTPSGGYHLIYRCAAEVPGNQKLAMSPDGKKVHIETRGQGGYALVAPSAGYSILQGDIENMPVISQDERNLLAWVASTFDERPPKTQKNNSTDSSDRPGDIFNSISSWPQLLQEDGWTFVKQVGEREHYTRPGKQGGSTSATLHPEKGLYVWSTSTQLPSETPLDQFGYLTHFRFSGDFSEAAKWVRKTYPGEFSKEIPKTILSTAENVFLPTEPQKKVVPVGIIDFLDLEFPPRENLLNPWLPSQGLAMVYAPRGIGKTFVALGVAYAVSSGGSFLGWQAPKPAGVLYIDGEMPGVVMQERLGAIVLSNEKEPQAPFVLLTPDLQPEGMPRVDTEEGQLAVENILTDNQIKLIVVDNISTLSGAKENEADGWTPIQSWALKQRAAGRSVLFIHHSGKGGQQRGTSRREDVLDTVIALKRPTDYQPDQGAAFEIHFEKARGIYGDDVRAIEASLTTDDMGRMSWLTRTVEAGTFDRVVQLLNDGLKQNEIAVELGLHKSNVSRHARRAQVEGLVVGSKKG